MSTVITEDVCGACGQTYESDFNCQTGEYTKLTGCRCDKKLYRAVQTVKELRKQLRKLNMPGKRAGGLSDCPKCKSLNSVHPEPGEIEYSGSSDMIETSACCKCPARFTVHWKAINWEPCK